MIDFDSFAKLSTYFVEPASQWGIADHRLQWIVVKSLTAGPAREYLFAACRTHDDAETLCHLLNGKDKTPTHEVVTLAQSLFDQGLIHKEAAKPLHDEPKRKEAMAAALYQMRELIAQLQNPDGEIAKTFVSRWLASIKLRLEEAESMTAIFQKPQNN